MTQQPETLTNLELLSRSWQEIKERFIPLFSLSLIAPIIVWLITGLCLGYNPASQNEPSMVMSIFVSIVSLLFSLWGFAAVVLYICKRVSSIQEALGLAVTRIPRLLGFVVLLVPVGIIVWLSLILSEIAGSNVLLQILVFILSLVIAVILAAGFVFILLAPYILILTDIPFFQAIKRSVSLVKHRYLKTLGFFGLLIVIVFVGKILLSLLLTFPQVLVLVIIPDLQGVLGWTLSLTDVIITSFLSIFAVLPLTAYYLNACQKQQQIEQDEDGPVVISNIR